MLTIARNKAVFLDRDGVINREKGMYIYKPEDFELNGGLIESLKILAEGGFILLVITNQSGIGQNIYTHDHVDKIHGILQSHLSAQGIELSAIYYCPHHPSSGNCLCRKPGSLLIEKALARFNIDPSLSFMIGDKERDIEAAEKAGVKGILVRANESLVDYALKIAGQSPVDK
jgi:D-glycero-D-manno-heptose 1,7-bisphosphate phosphatase